MSTHWTQSIPRRLIATAVMMACLTLSPAGWTQSSPTPNVDASGSQKTTTTATHECAAVVKKCSQTISDAQQDLEITHGRWIEARAQSERSRQEMRLLMQRVAELEARPSAWTWIAIGAGLGVSAVTAVVLLLQRR